jgi:hypothetical protein
MYKHYTSVSDFVYRDNQLEEGINSYMTCNKEDWLALAAVLGLRINPAWPYKIIRINDNIDIILILEWVILRLCRLIPGTNGYSIFVTPIILIYNSYIINSPIIHEVAAILPICIIINSASDIDEPITKINYMSYYNMTYWIDTANRSASYNRIVDCVFLNLRFCSNRDCMSLIKPKVLVSNTVPSPKILNVDAKFFMFLDIPHEMPSRISDINDRKINLLMDHYPSIRFFAIVNDNIINGNCSYGKKYINIHEMAGKNPMMLIYSKDTNTIYNFRFHQFVQIAVNL